MLLIPTSCFTISCIASVFYEWSDVTQLDSNIEVRNLDSNEVSHRLNQMESHLIRDEISHLDRRIELRHDTPLIEWSHSTMLILFLETLPLLINKSSKLPPVWFVSFPVHYIKPLHVGPIEAFLNFKLWAVTASTISTSSFSTVLKVFTKSFREEVEDSFEWLFEK